MRYALKTVIISGQQAIIKNHGDNIWCELCDTFADDFTLNEAAETLQYLRPFAPITRRHMLRCVLFNVMADATERPNAYERGCPVMRKGTRIWNVCGERV